MTGRVRDLSRRAIVLVLLLVATGIFTLPFLWSLSISFQPAGDVFRWPIELIPDEVTLQNYRRLWTEIPFARWLLNSSGVALAVTLANLFLDALAGYAFARLRFPGRNLLFALLLATLMVPAHVTLVPKFMLLNALGLVNTYTALIAPAMVQVVGIFLMKQFFESIPRQLEEAARIDGCNRFQVFWRVVLPASRPALAALGIYTFQGNWNEFLWPLVVTTTSDRFTLPVGLAMFRYEFRVEWTMLMAGAVLIALPTLLIFLVFQRLFIQGIATSGLKG
ncbi:carbohydrate ABC transporter permease [Methylocaldum sp.]|uniref:carbohydrate ABC transporter permease n=1 Tax=Methylocaldum sp. TaxID=1969727 RepID=UPI002D4E6A6E|nr:carbohydrate ABC transporter permease [Methylocaldum sp.]HYE36412.1 carbohydrate ABC transporter permease [Methylocaldum sp.]